jgi:predicted nucleic acid-binding protein
MTNMDEVWRLADKNSFPARRIYDARIAISLKNHGVKEFATRNVKDFKDFNFFKVINPID